MQDQIILSQYINNELRLKNAELQLEIARSKETESILLEANQILSLVAEISRNIVEDGTILDIADVLKKIGTRLDLNKIFLLRFSNSIDSYLEWVKDGSHSSSYNNNQDLVELMNWVYKRECYSGQASCLPKFLDFINCNGRSSFHCTNCNLIIIPLIIYNKPWGIIGYVKNTKINASELTKKSLHNLSNLLAILIKRDEDMQELSKLIDKKIEDFNSKLRKIKGE